MFRFEHPEYLTFLYLIPFLIAGYWFVIHLKNKSLANFADKKLHTILIPDYSLLKNIFRFVIIIFAIVLGVFALANPQVGSKLEEVKQKGIDVVICLDVSLSMQAEDIKPNRLEKAKFQISNLIQKLRGDRIGLIIFSGDAYVQFPLTTDYSAANLFLSAVDFNSVPQPGTAIAAAINMAVRSFDSVATQKVIVVITDGEDHEGDIDAAVSDAQEKNIKIYAIGLGSPDGVPIPIYDPRGKPMGFKQDRMGNTVLTKLDESILIKITEQGDGKYFRGSNYDDHLDKIFKDLSDIEKTEFGVKKVTDYEDRFYYFLIPAVMFLFVEFFMTDRKSKFYKKLNQKLGLEKED